MSPHHLLVLLALASAALASPPRTCLRLGEDGSGKESYTFKMTQSLESSPGRIQFRRHAHDHDSAKPFAGHSRIK